MIRHMRLQMWGPVTWQILCLSALNIGVFLMTPHLYMAVNTLRGKANGEGAAYVPRSAVDPHQPGDVLILLQQSV